MKITIKGDAIAHDEKGKVIKSPAKLKELDGVSDDSDFSEYFHEEEKALAKSAGVSGGELVFKFENGKLYALTTYECTRKLSHEEEETLSQYTTGQWSDGIGEGFEQHEERGAYISAWHREQELEIIYSGTPCPRCGEAMSDYPALSRRDNSTDICSDCGQEEAMLDFGRKELPQAIKNELDFLTKLARKAGAIKVTHLGEDYSTIEVNGEEYQSSLGLGEAIIEAQK